MLSEILMAGILAIIITLLVIFYLIRLDNSRTERERIRSDKYRIQNGIARPSYSSEGDEGDWVQKIISGVVASNPELVAQLAEKFLSKKE